MSDVAAAETADTVAQVQQILRAQFPGLSSRDIAALPDRLRGRPRSRFRLRLLVAEDWRRQARGFALLLHEPRLHFSLLEYISAARHRTGGGIGGALYERVRAEAGALGADALFLEGLPDDPALCGDASLLEQNAARLRFYELYGVRPLELPGYRLPVGPKDTCPPFLLYDDLGSGAPLRRARARQVVRAILVGKYGELTDEAYRKRVLASITEDPVPVREARYVAASRRNGERRAGGRQGEGEGTGAGGRPEVRASAPAGEGARGAERRSGEDRRGAGALVVNEGHQVHHVRERGYVESPVRLPSILRALEAAEWFRRVAARHWGEDHVKAIHDPDFVDYLKKICLSMGPNARSVYPYVFPIRNVARPPKDLSIRAGYYCIDTFTPLNRNAYLAARGAVDCALTAAELVLNGTSVAYALVRPPGHHAERRSFGGFCYFNSTAAAAHYLSRFGRVAILDVDYHHGNGQQDIFYARGDVLTVSIHGHPSFAYPYFSGFPEEEGEGEGKGVNLNLALPEAVDGARYRTELGRALRRIEAFAPRFLVVALGLDPARGDPTGTWSLTGTDFEKNGALIAGLGLPTLVVQEGGYRTRSLGVNARRFFAGLFSAGDAGDAARPDRAGPARPPGKK